MRSAASRPAHLPRRLFDTLFGRMALLSICVLLALQGGWFAILHVQGPHREADGYARALLIVLEAAHNDVALGGRLMRETRVHIVPVWNMPTPLTLLDPAKTRHAHLARQIADGLPEGSRIAIDTDGHRMARLWVLYPSSTVWIVAPIDLPPPAPFMMESIVMMLGALLLSLAVTWQLQRPLARVAQAAWRFGGGERPVPVDENGPRELRELIGAFNQMMRKLTDAEDDRAVMLAGIAHDLKAPLTRLSLRASVLAKDERERAHFLRDIDSMTRIVQQFLEFAGRSSAESTRTGVDAFIAEQFASPEDGEAPLFALSLEAGDAFMLPRTFVDRLMTNLVDNALEHGEPPIEIMTARRGDDWVIEVRDHGPGIPDERLVDVLRPFVRLDPARSGNGHCGLGLAIVERLAREQRGRCEIGNAESGGLIVRIVIPVQTP
ncbi:sensor signal transduction histidine kinase [Caballeronia hypogeia]|uniref:histidine kinase n=1 Tax=Caballeronia hypogeia TaxID=1777140 RepID=A0A158D5J4_9BURK|nr:ATP-binding protein [Caballeronia hypogeia]SAK89915.1 sensor signal transduction histidine kinase [Caballeronia hypogeia]